MVLLEVLPSRDLYFLFQKMHLTIKLNELYLSNKKQHFYIFFITISFIFLDVEFLVSPVFRDRDIFWG